MTALLPAADPILDCASQHTIALWLLDNMRLKAWERLLFVECGDGWVVEEAWRRMARGSAYGLSSSPSLVDSAVQLRGVPGCVEFSVWGDGDLRFPFPDHSFDRVISCASWDRYTEFAAVLQEMIRVLRVGGDAYVLDNGGSRTVESLLPLVRETGLAEVERSTPTGETTPLLIHARRPGPP